MLSDWQRSRIGNLVLTSREFFASDVWTSKATRKVDGRISNLHRFNDVSHGRWDATWTHELQRKDWLHASNPFSPPKTSLGFEHEHSILAIETSWSPLTMKASLSLLDDCIWVKVVFGLSLLRRRLLWRNCWWRSSSSSVFEACRDPSGSFGDKCGRHGVWLPSC